jgi:sugar phosphate permease
MTQDNPVKNSPQIACSNDIPKRRDPIFYGYWIVAASFIISLLTNGFVLLGFTALFEPIVNEFGWSYTQISLAASLRGVEVGLLSPLMGFFVDRFGPRRLVFIGIFSVGTGLLYLGQVHSLAGFYMGYIIIAVGLSFASPVVVLATMAYWFRKRLGMATGITVSGFACGGLLVPLVVKLIDAYDWRIAVTIIGITTSLICLPLSLMLRHRPEKYGLLPDGEKTVVIPSRQLNQAFPPVENEFTVRQALKSPAFWHIGLAMLFFFMSISTVTAHVMPYLDSIGIPRATAGFITMALPLVSIIGRIGSGWAGDRYNKKHVATGLFIFAIIGLGSTALASPAALWLLVPFIIFFGIGWGGSTTARVNMIHEYFGSGKFGSIFGLCMGMAALGTIVGPIYAGWVWDTWGGYQITWITLTALVAVGTIILVTTPPAYPKSKKV